MARAKLYFSEFIDDFCYPMEWQQQYMTENNLEHITLYEAEAESKSEYFYCREYFEVGLKGESCGKVCPGYMPRNGKSGICKHTGRTYEMTDKKLVINQKTLSND